MSMRSSLTPRATTNCLAPIAFLMNESVGIETGYMTTVHSVTGDQNTTATVHKDLQTCKKFFNFNNSLRSTGAARGRRRGVART